MSVFSCNPYTGSNKGALSSGRGAETLKAMPLLVTLFVGCHGLESFAYIHLEPEPQSCVIRCICTLVKSENGNIFQCYVFCFVCAMSRWTFCDVTKDFTIPCHLWPGVLHDLRDHQAAALFKKSPTKSGSSRKTQNRALFLSVCCKQRAKHAGSLISTPALKWIH